MSDIKSNLKTYRAKTDYTQQALADELGVSRQTINAIEQGKYQPSLLLAAKCAKLFGVSIEDIFIFPEL